MGRAHVCPRKACQCSALPLPGRSAGTQHAARASKGAEKGRDDVCCMLLAQRRRGQAGLGDSCHSQINWAARSTEADDRPISVAGGRAWRAGPAAKGGSPLQQTTQSARPKAWRRPSQGLSECRHQSELTLQHETPTASVQPAAAAYSRPCARLSCAPPRAYTAGELRLGRGRRPLEHPLARTFQVRALARSGVNAVRSRTLAPAPQQMLLLVPPRSPRTEAVSVLSQPPRGGVHVGS